MPDFDNTNGSKTQSNNTNGRTALNGLHTRPINLAGVTGVRFDQILEAPPVSPATKPKKRRGLKFTSLADVRPEPVRWLWPDRISRKLVLFTGPPDCGKTTVTIDVMARVTKGAPWPDGSGNAPLGSVIFLTAEDGLADTIRTRADAAGADVSRIYCLVAATDEDGQPSSFSLAQDIALLAEKVKEIGDVAMIVIDPITAYLGAGKIDTHKTADVRAILSPLKDFADEHGVAVLGLTHPSKSVTKAMNAATGSQGFVAAARATWLFTRETDDNGQETGRTLMLPIKNNLSARRHNGMAYRIAGLDFGNGISAPYVVWDGEPINITADQALAMAMEPGDCSSGDGGDLAKAMQFITEEFYAARLKGVTEIEAADLKDWARNAGFSEKTLRTARSKLGVVTRREGFGPGAKYYLSLLDNPSMDAQ
jgi:putative DNA primase/helicase